MNVLNSELSICRLTVQETLPLLAGAVVASGMGCQNSSVSSEPAATAAQEASVQVQSSLWNVPDGYDVS